MAAPVTPIVPIAFSTLGCPALPLAEVAAIAAGSGFAGVEVRAADGEPVHVGLDRAQRVDSVTALTAAGIRPLTVASYVTVADPTADDDTVIADGIAHGRLAADIGASFLRVFPSGPAPAEARTARDSDDAAARRIGAIVEGLAGTGVTVALETHDSHPRGADVARVLDRCPGAAAIWDTLHTWRAGEIPADTLSALDGRLGYVQVKDVASAGDLTPLPPGDGILPLGEVADSLRRKGYRGWVSWEYERAWYPQLPPLPDLAGSVASWMRATFGAG